MPSNAYMKPERGRALALFQAYGATLPDHDFNVETQRIIADLYWYFKEEDRGISFEDLVAKSIEDANNWKPED